MAHEAACSTAFVVCSPKKDHGNFLLRVFKDADVVATLQILYLDQRSRSQREIGTKVLI